LRKRGKSRKGAAKNLKRILILLLLIVAGGIFYELYSDRLREEKRPPEVTRPLPEQHGAKQRKELRESLPRETPPTVRDIPEAETPVLPPGKRLPAPGDPQGRISIFCGA